MKIFLFAIVLFVRASSVCSAQAFSNVDAKNLASDFYKSLAELSSSDIYKDHMATNKSLDVKDRLSCMILEKESMTAPNETQIFETSTATGKIYFDGYFRLYSDYARQYNTVLVNYEITNCEMVVSPSREKDLSSRRFYYYVQVRRDVKAKDITWHLWDLVCIDGNAGKIIGIGNKTFGGYIPDEYNNADYNSIMSHATWAYYKGDYDDAYNSYLKASWLRPNMCEPFYRMALMIYFKKGIKGRFKNAKERKTILKKYLYNAMDMERQEKLR